MSRYELQERRKKHCCESVKNIFDNAKRFMWESKFINESVNKLRAIDDYQRIPRHCQSYVESRVDLFREQLERQHVVFAYWILGEFVSIKSTRYAKLAPTYVYHVKPDCRSAMVYSDDTTKIYFES